MNEQIPERKRKVFALLLDTLLALRRENKEVIYSSMLKDTIKRKKPSFNEEYYGYRTFSELLEDAQKRRAARDREAQVERDVRGDPVRAGDEAGVRRGPAAEREGRRAVAGGRSSRDRRDAGPRPGPRPATGAASATAREAGHRACRARTGGRAAGRSARTAARAGTGRGHRRTRDRRDEVPSYGARKTAAKPAAPARSRTRRTSRGRNPPQEQSRARGEGRRRAEKSQRSSEKPAAQKPAAASRRRPEPKSAPAPKAAPPAPPAPPAEDDEFGAGIGE